MAVALLTLTPMVFAAGPAGGLAPDDGLQAKIKAAVDGLTEAPTEEQRQEAVEITAILGDRPGAGRSRLLEQIAIFLANADGTEEAMGGAILLRFLDFQREEILPATLPHLVAASPDLNKILRDIAATTVVASAGAVDPVNVILQIEQWRATPPEAATVAARRTEIGGLLNDLAGDDNRWVRAYAATVVASDPELVAPEVHRLLQED